MDETVLLKCVIKKRGLQMLTEFDWFSTWKAFVDTIFIPRILEKVENVLIT
jgi:hypothetical protein